MDISSKKQHLPSIFVLVLPLEREVQQSLEIVDVVGPVVLQEGVDEELVYIASLKTSHC